jgi:hypothetical protein
LFIPGELAEHFQKNVLVFPRSCANGDFTHTDFQKSDSPRRARSSTKKNQTGFTGCAGYLEVATQLSRSGLRTKRQALTLPGLYQRLSQPDYPVNPVKKIFVFFVPFVVKNPQPESCRCLKRSDLLKRLREIGDQIRLVFQPD